MDKCAVCMIPAKSKCSGCRNIVYCGREHQKEHWKRGHKTQCKCYEIKSNDTYGRFMTAARDIQKGEVILRELPTVIGPKVQSFPICLSCHQLVPVPSSGQDYYKCSQCKWPLCGPQCESSKQHETECKLMRVKPFNVIQYHEESGPKKESAYCVITPLRCLLLEKTKPELWKQILTLEDHLKERINTPLYKIMKPNLVNYIQNVLNLTEYDETLILKIAAILDTNAFEIRLPKKGIKIRGLYPMASMMAHDCTPKTKHIFNDDTELILIATVDIKKGEMITASYTQCLKSTIQRQEHLLQTKCFMCSCARCSDPTEFETFAGAILCSKCNDGMVIATNTTDLKAPWKCRLCSHEITAKQISWGNNAMQKEIVALPKNSPRPYEEFIIKYQGTLHERNTHVLQVKYALTQLYGNVKGFQMNELTDAGVQRKIDLCNELLEIAELFEPGWSHFRGNLLLDLQEAMVIQIKREFAKDLITKQGAQEKLMETMGMLQEAVDILGADSYMKELLQERVSKLVNEISLD